MVFGGSVPLLLGGLVLGRWIRLDFFEGFWGDWSIVGDLERLKGVRALTLLEVYPARTGAVCGEEESPSVSHHHGYICDTIYMHRWSN